ncbi:M1 family metallopeptidase [Microlunatus parietis]|uniref:Aminopeptidase N n=1 Tax=Microlunatus parietis TaxID=682979 RepID=A0A7Y9I4I8_9ACTN|nr:M1 family metallopeptidase [Microlunatus parietis]NYE70132.1 aminopeptidase N [Microlunatus parietis]
MSSVDPDWGPPDPWGRFNETPVRHRPYRAAYVFAVIMAVIAFLAVAVPVGIPFLVSRWTEQPPVVAPDPAGGRPGVGDPYFPDYGSSGYDAIKYTISVDWDPAAKRLSGRTVITARADQTLPSFYVDLALPVESVLVDGAPARHAKAGFQDVKITPREPVPAGRDFKITIEYAGEPGAVQRNETRAWYATGQEWTAAGEPESAAWWYPSNDHPSDVALMDVSVRVPAGFEVISVGRLESRDTAEEADHDTWRWIARQPMATYLNFISIGQYQIKEGVAAGRPYLYAVSEQLTEPERKIAFAQLEKSESMITIMEEAFGPYPFSEFGGVVPVHDFWFGGLETQTRPIYQRQAILDDDFAPELIMHELAHMWYGNHVTLAQWDDIFINESYATWAQWLYRERTGRQPAAEAFADMYGRVKDRPDFWRVTMIDPGPGQLFSTVYARGPMTLQALRTVIGDEAFFALAREWAADPGPRSVEQWMAAAQAKTSTDLGPFFDAWLRSTSAPDPTAANGFG